jgi:Tfp pilus assembly protein PilO
MILVFVAVIVFLDVPMVQGVLNSRNEIESNQSQLVEEQNFMNLLEKLISKYKSNEDILKNLDNILPENSDISNLLVQIEALVNAGGLTTKDVHFSIADDKDASKAEIARAGNGTRTKITSNYKAVTINLVAAGDYNALKKFLQATEENMRLIDVESISISNETQGSGALFNFEIVLKTYYIN